MRRHLELIKTIGRELRGVREDKQIQLQEVAKGVGVSSTYISDIERNNKVPSDELIEKLAEAYGVERIRLFKGFRVVPKQMMAELSRDGEMYEIIFKLSENETVTEAEKDQFYAEIAELYKKRFGEE